MGKAERDLAVAMARVWDHETIENVSGALESWFGVLDAMGVRSLEVDVDEVSEQVRAVCEFFAQVNTSRPFLTGDTRDAVPGVLHRDVFGRG